MAELSEIDGLETYEPQRIKDLTYEDKTRALESLILISEKRADQDGKSKIKGRCVAVGSKQRSYDGYEKSDGSSPTVITDSIFLTGVIEANENRAMSTIDVGNAFIQADNDERILMLVRGKVAELMVRVNPTLYRPYITYSKKGVPMLYVRLPKALYGMLRAALLFYKRLRKDLEFMGFEINPYDPCVANMMVNGAQCTVCWHVDDLKVSHVDEAVVTAFSLKLADLYKGRVKTHRGKVFDYLGMDLDYGSSPGALIVSMIKYLTTCLEEWPEELRGSKINPHSDNLFTIREDEDRELLPEELASQFHRTVAQLLFLCMRARPDIQTAVSVLTMRVKSPDVDDWGKLRHCLLYLKGTRHMKRYLSADSLSHIHWYVDASYGVHWDSKGHTGAMMTMGRGALINISRKHKLNVGSSTESELVSIADVLGVMMWSKYFMEAQGYTIENNVLYQDNKSTILLAKNVRMSAGKASRHIKNRFFLITDKIAQDELTVQHRGTELMWADGNTKPLQGNGFRLFRSVLMGIQPDYDDDDERRNTHPLLLPKAETEGIISKQDIDVLRRAIGPAEEQEHKTDVNSKSISPVNTVAKRRSVLDDNRYGPGNRPHWALSRTRFPNLIRALNTEPDMDTRKRVSSLYHGLMT